MIKLILKGKSGGIFHPILSYPNPLRISFRFSSSKKAHLRGRSRHNLVDRNRILSILLFAKTTNADVEVGVVDNDCHEGYRKLEAIWVKQGDTFLKGKWRMTTQL